MADKQITGFSGTRVGLLAMEQASRRPELLRLALTDEHGRDHFLVVAGQVERANIWEELRYSAPVREHGKTEELILIVWPNKRRAELRRQ